MSDIVSIGIKHIHPHPENPRKDLGDLSELVESIRKNGIMQNLTVIPQEDNPGEYTAIIGHRRHAAAVLAGITELPCRIIEGMSRKEQISTMLEENMQRNDLTIYEQAQGFQMMLDLGDTETQIAEKTGFSKATIRHRLNIAKLDQKELQKKEKDESFQLTLKDLYELEKVVDVKIRNKILKEATDSKNLVWRAKIAVTTEKKARNKKQFAELFKKAGIKEATESAANERYSGKWDILQSWDLEKDLPEAVGEFRDGALWVVYYDRDVAVIAPAKKQKKELNEYEIKAKEASNAKKELKQRHKILYAEIDKFLMGIITKEIEPLKEDVGLYRALTLATIKGGIDFSRTNLSALYSGKGIYELEHDEPEKYNEFLEWEKNLSPLHLAIAYMSSVRKYEMYTYNAEYHEKNAEKVKEVVGFLAKYGFSVSEEEQQMLDGTHELYRKRV